MNALERGDDGLPIGWPEDHGIASAGDQVAAWCETTLVQPDGVNAGSPWRFSTSQVRFLMWLYALDETGTYLWRRAQVVLPKGAGKSPLGAAIACAELCGPVVFDRWARNGEPVMRAHASPYVSLSALSYGQAQDATMDLARRMLDSPIAHASVERLDIGQLKIRHKRGQLVPSTASADSKEGIRLSFGILDESHLWTPTNRGTDLAKKIRFNLAKTGGRSVEMTNRWSLGAGSVAEATSEYASAVNAGQHKGDGVLVWAPVAPVKDLFDEDELRAALQSLYADSPWVDVERIIAEIMDGATSPEDARRFFLNESTSASDAFLPAHTWRAAARADDDLHDGDLIALGFDGSRGRGQGMADATGLVAVRLSDGFVKTLFVDQQRKGQRDWEPDSVALQASIAEAFERFKVRCFYADPALWHGEVADWERQYGRTIRQANRSESVRTKIAFPTNSRQRVAAAWETLYNAVVSGELTHDGHPLMLEHGMNARRSQDGQVFKEFNKSERKIDLLYCTMLAWEGRIACRRDGIIGTEKGKSRGRVILLD